MIARLSGSLVDRDGARAIIDVHGVGWEVFAPDRAIAGWLGAEARVDGRAGGRFVLKVDADGAPAEEAGILHVYRPTAKLEITWDKHSQGPWKGTLTQFPSAAISGIAPDPSKQTVGTPRTPASRTTSGKGSSRERRVRTRNWLTIQRNVGMDTEGISATSACSPIWVRSHSIAIPAWDPSPQPIQTARKGVPAKRFWHSLTKRGNKSNPFLWIGFPPTPKMGMPRSRA